MFTMLFANYKQGKAQQSLELGVQDFAGIFRKAQFWALTGKAILVAGDNVMPAGGYGVRIEECVSSPCHIFIFADFDGELDYDVGEELVNEEYFLPKDIIVSNISPQSIVNVLFKPPKPIICVNRDCSHTLITNIELKNIKSNNILNIKINQKSGQVSIEN